MTTTVHILSGSELVRGGLELLERTPAGSIWVHVGPSEEAPLSVLKERFGLHALAIKDCLHLDQRPKLEEYSGHSFIVVQGFKRRAGDVCDLQLVELHMFLGNGWLLTVSDDAEDLVGAVRLRVLAQPADTLGRGADHVAYMLADELVNSSFPLLDELDEELEALEVKTFEGASMDVLQRTFALRRTLTSLRRVLSPQRDVLGLLSREGVPNVRGRTSLYFRNVYDHLIRVHEQLESARDLLGNVTDVYLSVVANRTNDITKQLTIFASIFLPLSFVSGFFGQNFAPLSHPAFLWLSVTLTAALPLGLGLWFVRSRWW